MNIDCKKSVALIGNPNCGKTTLFNCLTSEREQVGNWSGVTVDKKLGYYRTNNDVSSTASNNADSTTVEVVDLPGCYSLVASQDMPLDQKITCEYVWQNSEHIFVNVIDASCLQRDLYLTMQLLELGLPMVVAVNCIDIADKQGIKIDTDKLAVQLKCQVVAISSKYKQGIEDLKAAINLTEISHYRTIVDASEISRQPEIKSNTGYEFIYPAPVRQIIENWQQVFSKVKLNLNHKGLIVKALESDMIINNKLLEMGINFSSTAKQLTKNLTTDLDVWISTVRHERVNCILNQVKSIAKTKQNKQTRQTKQIKSKEIWLDKIILNKFLSLPIFLTVMYAMFFFAINLSGKLQECIEIKAKFIFEDGLATLLTNLHIPQWFINIAAHGVGHGINITLTFIPVLFAMFFFLSFLEHSGYMTRAVFIVDRLMQTLGLPGKSFVPMIVGFGCNVPAIMGARALANNRERILTILMTPFMSCGARLAIYAVFVAIFFPRVGHNIIFSLYLIGVIVAVLTGIFLRVNLQLGKPAPMVLQLSDYKWPSIWALCTQAGWRLRKFISKAGIIIIPICVLLNGVGVNHIEALGKRITPIFAPIGIKQDNWPATVSLITGIMAKEAVIGTLDALYATKNLQVTDEVYGNKIVDNFGGAIGAFAYLLFVLLYTPCVSVVAVIYRELNIRWAIFSIIWPTVLAYLVALMFYQIATFSLHPSYSSVCLLGVGAFVGACLLFRLPARRNGVKPLATPVCII